MADNSPMARNQQHEREAAKRFAAKAQQCGDIVELLRLFQAAGAWGIPALSLCQAALQSYVGDSPSSDPQTVWIVFDNGAVRDNQRFDFKSLDELNAFLRGLDAMYGHFAFTQYDTDPGV